MLGHAIGHDNAFAVLPNPRDKRVGGDFAAKADIAQHGPGRCVLRQMTKPFKDQPLNRSPVLLVESAEVGRSPEMVFFLQRVAGFHKKVGPRPLGRGPEHVSP